MVTYNQSISTDTDRRMKLSPLESFECYISPINHGADFIKSEGLTKNCHGIELKVCLQDEDTLGIVLTPLPLSYVKAPNCDFILAAKEKLKKPELQQAMENAGNGAWVHSHTYTDRVPMIGTGKTVKSLVMVFESMPEFTEEDARKWKLMMEV